MVVTWNAQNMSSHCLPNQLISDSAEDHYHPENTRWHENSPIMCAQFTMQVYAYMHNYIRYYKMTHCITQYMGNH